MFKVLYRKRFYDYITRASVIGSLLVLAVFGSEPQQNKTLSDMINAYLKYMSIKSQNIWDILKFFFQVLSIKDWFFSHDNYIFKRDFGSRYSHGSDWTKNRGFETNMITLLYINVSNSGKHLQVNNICLHTIYLYDFTPHGATELRFHEESIRTDYKRIFYR